MIMMMTMMDGTWHPPSFPRDDDEEEEKEDDHDDNDDDNEGKNAKIKGNKEKREGGKD